MIHTLILITVALSTVAGGITIALGEWRRFALKFAAVSLCFMVDVCLLGILLFHPDELTNPFHYDISAVVNIILLSRNIVHILFYIACGRDAIAYRKNDRRAIYQSYRRAA